MNEEREKVYQILELGKHIKNLHHKKGFGGLLFIDLSMIKFSKLSSYIRQLDKENQELNKQLEDKTEDYKRMKDNFDSKVDVLTKIEAQQKEFINYLEDELDRLARACSQVYEDSLGKTRLVNEDIFNEVNDILQKCKSIIGDINDKK